MAKKKKVEGINEVIELNGVNARVEKNMIILEKNGKKIEKKVNSIMTAEVENDKVVLKTKKAGRVERRLVGSVVSHIKNAVNGFAEPFKYRLQISNVHFPMTVSYDKATNQIVVKNFLGEKKDRKINVRDNVEVKVGKEIIELESPDIENAGQTAANIEKGTKVRHRDRRIFQDGIFIIEKPGRVFL